MKLPFRRWRPRHLLLGWLAYWVAAAFVALGPAALAIWRLSRDATGHGNVSASFGSAGVSLTVIQGGQTTWTGAASLLVIAAGVAIPPLLLWIAWVAARRNEEVAPAAVQGADAPLLGGAVPSVPLRVTPREPMRARRS